MDVSALFLDRIALAALLGAILGIERELHGRPAGLRTNLMIAIGACLFGILSSEAYADADGMHDPTRIASIVVQGLGFLGAGAIIKEEEKILGMTTASAIWLSGAVGLACGAGMLALAAFVTLFGVGCLVLLRPLSKMLGQFGEEKMQERGEKVVKDS